MANRVLVTGGAGFIGSHVSDLVLSRGWSVEILDDFSSGRRGNAPAATKVRELDVGSSEATCYGNVKGQRLCAHGESGAAIVYARILDNMPPAGGRG